MNKKLITLAVAAAMAAPAAALADATLYGKARVSIDYIDADQNFSLYGPGSVPSGVSVDIDSDLLVPDTIFVTEDEHGVPTSARILPAGDFEVTETGFLLVDGVQVPVNVGDIERINAAQDFNGWDVNTRASRLGVKGSEDLGGGLKGIYQIEFEVPLVNTDEDIDNGDRGRIKMRNSFVGLKGNFGTFLVGRHDTPLKISTGKLDLFNDTIADYQKILGFHDVRADNTITYLSPNFAGFQFAGAVIPAGGITPVGVGVPGDSPDGIADAWSIAGIYKNGPFYASAAYESLGEDHWKGFEEEVTVNGVTQNAYNGILNYGSADDWNKWRLGLGILDWNGFTLAGLYESQSNVLGAPKKSDMDIWQIQAAYSFGNNTIKAAYGQNDVESCVGTFYSQTCSSAVEASTGLPASDVAFLNNRDFDNWTVGFDHNFSKRTQVYALYTQTSSDQDDSDWSAFSLGINHAF